MGLDKTPRKMEVELSPRTSTLTVNIIKSLLIHEQEVTSAKGDPLACNAVIALSIEVQLEHKALVFRLGDQLRQSECRDRICLGSDERKRPDGMRVDLSSKRLFGAPMKDDLTIELATCFGPELESPLRRYGQGLDMEPTVRPINSEHRSPSMSLAGMRRRSGTTRQ